MSADNWAKCPHCEHRRQTEVAELDRRLANAYSEATQEQYEALRAQREERATEDLGHTFREDYEFFGAETGAVHVSYSGSCSDCGLEMHIDETYPLEVTK